MGDKILVLDLECSCWMGPFPDGLRQEIIEIGYCIFHTKTKEISDKRSIIVKPQSPKIHGFCTKITGLTTEMVHSGTSSTFKEAYRSMLDDVRPHGNMTVATWGKNDKGFMMSDCLHYGLDYPFREHLDVQRAFRSVAKKRQDFSVKGALEILGLTFEGQQHRAGDDAYNTAVILSHIPSSKKK